MFTLSFYMIHIMLFFISLSVEPPVPTRPDVVDSGGKKKAFNDNQLGKGTPKLFGSGYKLREEAHFAFKKMQAEALKEGIKIGAVSSYRNFDH